MVPPSLKVVSFAHGIKEENIPIPYATGSGTEFVHTTAVNPPAKSNPGIDQNQDKSRSIFRNTGLALYLAIMPSRNGLPPPEFTATISSTM